VSHIPVAVVPIRIGGISARAQADTDEESSQDRTKRRERNTSQADAHLDNRPEGDVYGLIQEVVGMSEADDVGKFYDCCCASPEYRVSLVNRCDTCLWGYLQCT